MNKVALVTGGSRGIGKAICLKLAENNFDIVFVCKSDSKEAKEAIFEIELRRAKCKVIYLDLAQPHTYKEIIEQTAAFGSGRIDVLVNNAGIGLPEPLSEIDESSFKRQLDTNLAASIFLTKQALPYLRKTKGSVVNISSINGQNPVANASIYCATKAALEAATRSLAYELGQYSVRVNAVAPGFVDTDLLRSVSNEDMLERIVSSTSLGRLGTPMDIAKVVYFLLSSDSFWITGQTLRVDGGLTM